MSENTFKAIVVHKSDAGQFTRHIEERTCEDLPPGEVLIQVQFSSLNYKDALSATGHPGVTRNFPHTPGIDAAGLVEESSSADFAAGDPVLVTGYDLGMGTPGGYGRYIRVPAAWVLPLPVGFSLQESMIYGTAGFTSAQCIHELEAGGVTPERGEILVTGATGGVGSLAVGMLARAGYQVVAASGKMDAEQYLLDLGAGAVLRRDEIIDDSGKPLLSGRWAGVVDAVGGTILATAIKSARDRAVVTCCGLVAAAELPTTVYPFILRGIRLVGINSVDVPMPLRRHLWSRMATEWKLENLEHLSRTCALEGLEVEIERILQGRQKGRVVVDLAR